MREFRHKSGLPYTMSIRDYAEFMDVGLTRFGVLRREGHIPDPLPNTGQGKGQHAKWSGAEIAAWDAEGRPNAERWRAMMAKRTAS